MKIAFLTPEYPHPKTGNSGGIGTSIKNLAAGLLAQGCKVRVLVYGQKEDAVFEEEGITIQQIKNVKLKGLSWWLTRKKIENIINQLYKEGTIDLVEAPDWTGITSFIQPKKCPIVIRLHGSDTYFCHLDQRRVKWVNKFHEKRALQKANGHIAVSEFTANLTNQLFGLNKKFTIIPNGINTQTFVNESNPSLRDGAFIKCSANIFSEQASRRMGVATRQPLERNLNLNSILYFGTLIRKKGLLELTLIFNKVVEQHPSAQLILVGRDASDIISGNPSTWEMMQQLFTPVALENVTYKGSVPYEKIKQYIQEATVCVFPTFAEALPVSWLEAMAMQKAIVASNVGWASEVIDDGINGFLTHPTNHVEYAHKINQLLENETLRNEFGIAAREKVLQKFSIEIVAKQSLMLYENILAP
ncbi:MAG: glycosyltransferase family 4 protein [Lutibacter sp.]|jgi:glycosyltransferase involved in cell wall biosynthesis